MGGNFNFNSAASRAFPATLERVSLIAPIPGKKLSNVKIASLAAAPPPPPFSFPPPGYLYTNFARCAERKGKKEKYGRRRPRDGKVPVENFCVTVSRIKFVSRISPTD